MKRGKGALCFKQQISQLDQWGKWLFSLTRAVIKILQHVDLCTTWTAPHCQRKRLWAVFRGHTLTVVYGRCQRKPFNLQASKSKNTILSEEQRKNAHFFSIVLSLAYLQYLCVTCTYHRIHEEICPSPRFSLYKVWGWSRRFHLEWVWQPDNFRGFDVIHISCSIRQNVNNWKYKHILFSK